jgi:hypothetical protein
MRITLLFQQPFLLEYLIEYLGFFVLLWPPVAPGKLAASLVKMPTQGAALGRKGRPALQAVGCLPRHQQGQALFGCMAGQH